MESYLPISSADFSKQMQDFSLPKKAAVAIAVSGGADSMCLLRLMQIWCNKNHHTLIALTVNHGLRSEAVQEAEKVADWCNHLKISHQILNWEGNLPKSNIQAEARTIRYQLLENYCNDKEIAYLFLAHHQQDQAETVLLRLIRGASVTGLAAMKKQTKRNQLFLIRPLLSFSSERIEATIQQFSQDYISDPSNHDTRYMRVVVRHFLNELERKNEVITHITGTAQHMQRVDDFLTEVVDEAESKCLSIDPLGFVNFDKHLLLSLHPEIALRLLSKAISYCLGGITSIRFEEMERLYQHLNSANAKATTLAGCLIKSSTSKHENHRLFILRETSALPETTDFREKTMFDNRFFCQWPSLPKNDTTYRLGALGSNGFQQIRNEITVEKLPKEVFYALPALWHLEKVVAVPHIGYLGDKIANDFSAHFSAFNALAC